MLIKPSQYLTMYCDYIYCVSTGILPVGNSMGLSSLTILA